MNDAVSPDTALHECLAPFLLLLFLSLLQSSSYHEGSTEPVLKMEGRLGALTGGTAGGQQEKQWLPESLGL